MSQEHSNKKSRNLSGINDALPKFNFKQAFFLVTIMFILFSIGLFIIENLSGIYRLFMILVLSLLVGFTVPAIQFYNEKHKKKSKSKLIIGALFSLLAFIMLFSFIFLNTIL